LSFSMNFLLGRFTFVVDILIISVLALTFVSYITI
jgi:hypothetical protein